MNDWCFFACVELLLYSNIKMFWQGSFIGMLVIMHLIKICYDSILLFTLYEHFLLLNTFSTTLIKCVLRL